MKYLFNATQKTCISLLEEDLPPVLSTWESHCFTTLMPRVLLPIIVEHNFVYFLPAPLYSLCQSPAKKVTLLLKDYPDILIKFLDGKEILAGAITDFIYNALRPPIMGGKKYCQSIWRELVENAHEEATSDPDRSRQYLLPTMNRFQVMIDITELCSTYQETFNDSIFERISEIWTSLPKTFGLAESWTELKHSDGTFLPVLTSLCNHSSSF
ncbi:hypothetical protein M422DRAFT_56912 [Sphaerobolus stellatus SS14]|uniref:Uncharacterized protein n=1 Tax=Sphaerobolus stellatus (strain SS14) TaxID=990650 RepID=A0A0C9U2D5_SPHS4|nr:hypothetical protein M422DRAFT_56912 [Sphaerobolus stellatus SS14]